MTYDRRVNQMGQNSSKTVYNPYLNRDTKGSSDHKKAKPYYDNN